MILKLSKLISLIISLTHWPCISQVTIYRNRHINNKEIKKQVFKIINNINSTFKVFLNINII